jgi:hypothetical protein
VIVKVKKKEGVDIMSNKLQDHEKMYNDKKLSYFEFNSLVYLHDITGYLIDIDKRLVSIEDKSINIDNKLKDIKSNTELIAAKNI